ncbi:hypothetical protein [Alteromonas facilis]|uniref:hypothetical protein n=1 Tax=Alteromonas facilis TaxID=2048004 RepID=UPI000C28C8B0|nr:hypothetical protein [Alteromonas facilis]
MSFSSHGDLTIWVEDNIIFMDLSGGWNLEKAKEFIYEINHNVSPIVTPPFGAVGILRDDWMPTSDAVPYLHEATLRAIEAGLVREAYVSSSPISSRVTKSLVVPPDSDKYQSKEFTNIDEALEWLRHERAGLKTVHNE